VSVAKWAIAKLDDVRMPEVVVRREPDFHFSSFRNVRFLLLNAGGYVSTVCGALQLREPRTVGFGAICRSFKSNFNLLI
jgi:hypothetical protein